MNITLENTPLGGNISAISSKSYAHRALICAALSDGVSKIKCDNLSKDIEATADCLIGLGADIKYKDKIFTVKPINILNSTKEIDCGESGSTLRFLLPIIGALGLEVVIKMHGRLPQRPLFPLDREMQKYGCEFYQDGDKLQISGKLVPADYVIEGNISSQFISGLLFALPIIKGRSRIIIKDKFESYSYVKLTLEVLKNYGIEYTFENNTFELVKGEYISSDSKVEGDWSNAAFWLCAGALSKSGITVDNLNFKSVHGDKKIIDILKSFGADITVCGNSATVKSSNLKGISVNASDIPDLVPIIALTACKANGNTVITNAERLRIKESDRIKTVIEMINNLGGNAQETPDGMIITGTALKGGIVNSHNDHRIAMTAAVASQICQNNVTIIDANAVTKSYPDFFKDFETLNGKIKEKIQ